MLPSFALIIRCFNEEEHIGRLLTGVEHQTVRPDEVIVVDSGSTDATLGIASAFGVTVTSISPEDFSFGRALNRGIAQATGHDVCVFASAHVYPVYDTWLAHLTAPFDRPEVALTYGRQQAPLDGRLSEARLLRQWFPSTSTTRQTHPFCNNANAAIRRSVWADLPYDEDLTGLEDLDWAKRAMSRGHSVSYVAEAPVVHVHDESMPQVMNRYRREAVAHKQIYAEQQMSVGEAFRLGAINIAGDGRAAIADRALLRNLTDIFRFRLAQFYGTYRGFNQAGPVPDALRRRFYYPGDQSIRAHGAPAPGRLIEYEGVRRR